MDRYTADELLDRPGQPPADVASSLRDVAIINRWLGGISVTLGHLRQLAGRFPETASFSALDLAAGSGDIPRAAVRWARERGLRIEYTLLDVNPAIIEVGRTECDGWPEIRWVRGDARGVPFRDSAFDFATCSLALHHFDPDDAVRILREMNRVSARGLVLNDLRRSRAAWVAITALTRLLGANRLTRHDGPVSTLRAYTPSELRSLARRAGLERPRVERHAFFRMALVVAKEGKLPLHRRPS